MSDESTFGTDAFHLADRLLDNSADIPAVASFGPYQIIRLLGRGGMGDVYLAWDQTGERRVAIKFLRQTLAQPDLRERFTREIRTLGTLDHASIARLYEAGVHPDGTPYFVMEYVEGEPLDEYCRSRRSSIGERLQLFRAVCEALQFAHSRLVLHRDLKPSNILVTRNGAPKLLDFGIAKQMDSLNEAADQTQAMLRFTPAFAAPEQLRGEPVGVFTDVYSLGVILYGLLTDRQPYNLDGCTREEAERMITSSAEPEKPSGVISPAANPPISRSEWSDLDVLCLKAMKKDTARRYASVVEVIQELDRYFNGEPLKARPDSLGYRAGKFVRRNKGALAASLAVLGAMAAMISFFTLRVARERDRANEETARANATVQFLSDDLLAQSNPFRDAHAHELFTDVVTEASSRIDSRFAGQPAIAGRLHRILAGSFDDRSDFPKARVEYQEASRLLRRAGGELSPEAIEADLRLATMEARTSAKDSLALAGNTLRDSDNRLARMPIVPNDVKAADFYARGAVAIAKSDAQQAAAEFTKALSLLNAAPSSDINSRLKVERMLSFAWIRMGDSGKAEPLLRRIVGELSTRYGPEGPATLVARISLAESLYGQHKFREAVAEANQMYPVLLRKLGKDHEATLTILGTRAASEGSLEMWDDAIRDDLTIYDISRRKQAISITTIASLSDAALSQCQAGRYAEGEANARKAYRESKNAYGARAGLTGGIAYTLAVCLTRQNQLSEASALLDNIDVRAVMQTSGDPSVPGEIELGKAEIAVRRHDYVLAAKHADAGQKAFGSRLEDRDAKDLRQVEEEIATHQIFARR